MAHQNKELDSHLLGALPEIDLDALDPDSADSLPMDLVLVSGLSCPAGDKMAVQLDGAGFAALPTAGSDPCGWAPFADSAGRAKAPPQALGRVLFVPARRLARLRRLDHYRVIFRHVNPRPPATQLAVHVEGGPQEEIERARLRHQQAALGGLQLALNLELLVLDEALLRHPDQASRTLVVLLGEEMAATGRVSGAT